MRFDTWAITKALLIIFIFTVLVIIFIPRHRPCEEPLTYRIGKIDERFGLSAKEVLDAAVTAAALWGKAVSRELFQESPTGAIEINFVYDYRQEATDKLKLLSYNIDNTKSSYEDLKARLENQKNELQSIHNYLQAQQEEMKGLADTINNLVVVINEIATNLNLDVVNYRDMGEPLAKEFNEGSYVTEKGKKTITIYQFSDRNRLIRVLTHEFGHALGLKHSDKPNALMYRMNQSDSIELDQADIALLKARCEDK